MSYCHGDYVVMLLYGDHVGMVLVWPCCHGDNFRHICSCCQWTLLDSHNLTIRSYFLRVFTFIILPSACHGYVCCCIYSPPLSIPIVLLFSNSDALIYVTSATIETG